MTCLVLPEGVKLKDLCATLDVDYDDARYILARGGLPTTIAELEPGRGNHRVFKGQRAFYLAVCLKLKAAGVHTAIAARAADWSRRILLLAKNDGWGCEFPAWDSELKTQHQWYVDIGDDQFARLVTDANPSMPGLREMPWVDMTIPEKRRPSVTSPTARPAIILRVDLVRIAEQLQGCGPRNPPIAEPQQPASQLQPAVGEGPPAEVKDAPPRLRRRVLRPRPETP